MNVLSLFSGIGGLDLGLQRAGMTIVGQVEIDPWCRERLAERWPEVPRHDDVRTCLPWWGGRPVDLVAGGIPCQPSSRAGKRKAQADSRWLWPEFAGTVRHLRPRFVLVENPPGILDPVAVKDDEGRVIGYTRAPVEDVVGDLAALGYDTEWDCVPAAYVGASHIRDRIFFVAYPRSHQLRQQPGRRNGQSGPGAPLAGGDGATQPLADTEGLSGELWQATGEPPGRPAGRRLDVADPGGTRLAQREGQPADTGTQLTAAERDRGRPRDVAHTEGIRRGNRPRIFRRMGPARCGRWPAEPDVGRVAHGVPHRVDRLRGLGNAVVPQVAEHIGRLIMEAAA